MRATIDGPRARRKAAIAALTALTLTAPTAASAQSAAPSPAAPSAATVERSARAAAGKPVRVGVYLNVQPDCSSGPLPSIRLVSPPRNGTVKIKRGKISATNYKQCLALEVPGFVAFYQSKADFTGTDTVTLEVKFPQGRIEVQRITVTVGVGPGGQKI
ncbi:hypothetical protein SR870_08735 [Rhodopseudomonas palustris]|uniref:hypothetical protein n=1 Tax=Rhodopseudomonas palustris TaxID=1076 RepID=UPI002ACD759F|nr:hypothetical protein [Rhodopseudomonas palustris]WQH01341.1 hypothetical protein SR870_08735 [Rhodopseudomonas palustris]